MVLRGVPAGILRLRIPITGDRNRGAIPNLCRDTLRHSDKQLDARNSIRAAKRLAGALPILDGVIVAVGMKIQLQRVARKLDVDLIRHINIDH